MTKKAPGPVRRLVRDAQLIASVGLALLITYAVLTSSLVLAVELPPLQSQLARELLSALLSQGSLFLLAPALCYAARLMFDIRPWRLGLGSALFVRFALLLLRYITGGFDEDVDWVAQLLELGAALAAGALAAYAAMRAAARVEAKLAAQPAPAIPAPDLGEQLRRVQETARAAAPEAAAPTPAPDVAAAPAPLEVAAPAPAADGSVPDPDKA